MTGRAIGFWRRGWPALAIVAALGASPARAGDVADDVRARGRLRCGVSEGIAGFSEQDATGAWRGLDADLCRALAAAVLGDAESVEFVSLKASMRFSALQMGKIDLLARNTTWTLTREALLRVQFPAVLYYDGQTFLVAAAAQIEAAEELDGATVCMAKDADHERALKDWFGARGLSVAALELESAGEAAAAFLAGRCRALTSDASQLAGVRLRAPGGPAAFEILPQWISKQPLAPAVSGGDPEWASVVRWVLYALILAEERGITRESAGAALAAGRLDPITGGSEAEERALAQALDVAPGWAARAVAAVGHYGEAFERNLGRGSPLGIERGPNRLWSDGGLLYVPPID